MPLVFVVVPDPVGSGLVASLAHPGGNLTGLSFMAPDLNAKRLSLLKEAIPNLSRVGLLQDRSLDPVTTKNNAESYSKAATTMDAGLRQIEVPTPEAIDEAFSAAALDGREAVVVVGSMLANEGARVGASALTHRMPTLSMWAEKVPFGLLMSYGQNVVKSLRKARDYVDKILKGAKPSDLPVEQPTRLKLGINLRAAKVLDVTADAANGRR
jgi:putative ABC transport system substrate-binding protein